MTRNEALDKVFLPIGLSPSQYQDYKETIISTLQLLGLIKFDEEKVPPATSIIALQIGPFTGLPHLKADKIIDALAKYGYIITRKGT